MNRKINIQHALHLSLILILLTAIFYNAKNLRHSSRVRKEILLTSHLAGEQVERTSHKILQYMQELTNHYPSQTNREYTEKSIEYDNLFNDFIYKTIKPIPFWPDGKTEEVQRFLNVIQLKLDTVIEKRVTSSNAPLFETGYLDFKCLDNSIKYEGLQLQTILLKEQFVLACARNVSFDGWYFTTYSPVMCLDVLNPKANQNFKADVILQEKSGVFNNLTFYVNDSICPYADEKVFYRHTFTSPGLKPLHVRLEYLDHDSGEARTAEKTYYVNVR